MRRMKYGESCLQIPEEILEAAGLDREPDVLIGMRAGGDPDYLPEPGSNKSVKKSGKPCGGFPRIWRSPWNRRACTCPKKC